MNANLRVNRSNGDGREPELAGQTVVVIGGSAGIGLETARRARAEGAERDPRRRAIPNASQRAALELGARAPRPSTPPTSTTRSVLRRSARADRPRAGHRPRPLLRAAAEIRLRRGAPRPRRSSVAAAAGRPARRRQGPAGRHAALHGRHRRPPPGAGLALIAALTAAMPALIANLALELAPIRVNLIAAGFVDTPLSAALLGDDLEARRDELRATLPIRRVVGPGDVAALAVHLMTNTALTGATYDIDGGQQLVEGSHRVDARVTVTGSAGRRASRGAPASSRRPAGRAASSRRPAQRSPAGARRSRRSSPPTSRTSWRWVRRLRPKSRGATRSAVCEPTSRAVPSSRSSTRRSPLLAAAAAKDGRAQVDVAELLGLRDKGLRRLTLKPPGAAVTRRRARPDGRARQRRCSIRSRPPVPRPHAARIVARCTGGWWSSTRAVRATSAYARRRRER